MYIYLLCNKDIQVNELEKGFSLPLSLQIFLSVFLSILKKAKKQL